MATAATDERGRRRMILCCPGLNLSADYFKPERSQVEIQRGQVLRASNRLGNASAVSCALCWALSSPLSLPHHDGDRGHYASSDSPRQHAEAEEVCPFRSDAVQRAHCSKGRAPPSTRRRHHPAGAGLSRRPHPVCWKCRRWSTWILLAVRSVSAS